MTEKCQDPNDPLNSAKYHSGKKCIEDGCDRPAGTAWSPHWCQPCNAARMDKISSTLGLLGIPHSKQPGENGASKFLIDLE